MTRSLVLAVFLGAACARPTLETRPNPLQDPGGECRTYASGMKYCGARQGGYPNGRGTLTFPDGKTVTGIWDGMRATDVVMVKEGATYSGPSYAGGGMTSTHLYVPHGRPNGRVLVVMDGKRRQFIDYHPDGSVRSVSTGQAGIQHYQVTQFHLNGAVSTFTEIDGVRHGLARTVEVDGRVNIELFDHGKDLTKTVLPAQDLEVARESAMAEAESERQAALREASAAQAEKTRADKAVAFADEEPNKRRPKEETKKLCQCIAEKRGTMREDWLVGHCANTPTSITPGDYCYCVPPFDYAICVDRLSDPCTKDAACKRARDEEHRARARRCHAESDALVAAIRKRHEAEARVCARLTDPAKIQQEWDRIAREANDAIDAEILEVRNRAREESRRAEAAHDAAQARARAAEEKREAKRRAGEAELAAELARYQKNRADSIRQEIERVRTKRTVDCKQVPKPCTCTPMSRDPRINTACPM